jgi:hypothetical protein
MNLMTPPEIADGGYWYVVPVVTDAEGGRTPGLVAGQGWCAWYSGEFVAIRTPEAVVGLTPADQVTVDEILSANTFAGKPYARIGGN